MPVHLKQQNNVIPPPFPILISTSGVVASAAQWRQKGKTLVLLTPVTPHKSLHVQKDMKMCASIEIFQSIVPSWIEQLLFLALVSVGH